MDASRWCSCRCPWSPLRRRLYAVGRSTCHAPLHRGHQCHVRLYRWQGRGADVLSRGRVRTVRVRYTSRKRSAWNRSERDLLSPRAGGVQPDGAVYVRELGVQSADPSRAVHDPVRRPARRGCTLRNAVVPGWARDRMPTTRGSAQGLVQRHAAVISTRDFWGVRSRVPHPLPELLAPSNWSGWGRRVFARRWRERDSNPRLGYPSNGF